MDRAARPHAGVAPRCASPLPELREAPAPPAGRRALAALLEIARVGARRATVPHLPPRAAARLDRDPFVRRLARLE